MTITENLNPRSGSPFVQGARDTSPKAAMYQILNDNPGTDKDAAVELFIEKALADPELNRVALEVVAINAYSAWDSLRSSRPSTSSRLSASARRTDQASVQRRASRVVQRIVNACILDFVMPNEKKVRDCTFKEMGQFGKKFQRIAAAGQPSQIVGQVLSARKAKALMR